RVGDPGAPQEVERHRRGDLDDLQVADVAHFFDWDPAGWVLAAVIEPDAKRGGDHRRLRGEEEDGLLALVVLQLPHAEGDEVEPVLVLLYRRGVAQPLAKACALAGDRLLTRSLEHR